MNVKGIGIYEYGGKENLSRIQLPDRELESNEVKIMIKAAAVNPVDWKLREGYLKEDINYELPLILGWDVAGIVKEVGSSVSKFKVGDYIYSRPDLMKHGSYADEMILEEYLVSKKPSTSTFEEAASFPLVGLTTIQALIDHAKLQSGEKVLIHAGAGGIGTFAIQFAKAMGAYVVTTTSAKNHEFVKGLGADEIIHYDEEDFSNVVNDVDVVFDTLGGDVLLKSYEVLTHYGRLVTIAGGPNTIVPRNETADEKEIKTYFEFTDPNGKQLDDITPLVEEGKIRAVVDTIYPLTLEGVKEAHAHSEQGRTKGKIVLSSKSNS